MNAIDFGVLKTAVLGDGVAFRRVTRLQPAGGAGDKVFPPTYVKEGKAETKYALELRKLGGRDVQTVLLDSVASQANRMEEALLEGHRRGELDFPLVQVDFSKEEGLEDLEVLTTLQTPHRIADALLRDSLLDGQLFRATPVGRAFTDARPNHATAMYKYCPTALLFGVWDSTGPKGGLGSKFQRCIVSEIVGIDVVAGVKTASRLDPTGIQKGSEPIIFKMKGQDDWTPNAAEAEIEKKVPVPFNRGGEGKPGQPSKINHGNIPPSIETDSGGVTMGHALQTTVLSLPGLRRLRFRENLAGEPIPSEVRDAAEGAARTALAALGLAGFVYLDAQGYDLRSRSLLVPEQPGELELVGRDGRVATYALTKEVVVGLLRQALDEAAAFGMRWVRDPISLVPAPKLAQLIRASRSQVQAGAVES